MNIQQTQPDQPQVRRFSGLQVLLIVLVTMLLTAAAGWWVLTRYVFPTSLDTVNLSGAEQTELNRKLAMLGVVLPDTREPAEVRGAVPQPYSEVGASRTVELSERELNGLIARDPELGSRVALDLSPDLVSVTALVPVPDDFPLMPGKTVRVQAGAELAFRNGAPALLLRGVSIMGVPLPNAWLGNLKNVDLITEYGGEPGFWNSTAAGIETIEVREGRLVLQLKE